MMMSRVVCRRGIVDDVVAFFVVVA